MQALIAALDEAKQTNPNIPESGVTNFTLVISPYLPKRTFKSSSEET